MAIRAGGAEDTMKGLKSYTEAKLLWITRLADVFIPVFFALAVGLIYNPTAAYYEEGWLYVALAAASLLTFNIFHNLDLYTIPANLAGLPGLSIPCGFGKDNLPVGLHIVGNYFTEAKMLNVAHQYQKATDWHKREPAGIQA